MKNLKLLASASIVCLTLGLSQSVQAGQDEYSYKETKVTTTKLAQEPRSDYAIRNDLDSKIDSMSELDDDINLDVCDSVVTLSGTVDNYSEKDLALRVAKDIDGVDSVVDRIRVE